LDTTVSCTCRQLCICADHFKLLEKVQIFSYTRLVRIDLKAYEAKGSGPVDPWGLLAVVEDLIKENTAFHLMLAVMLVVGVAICLRSDEIVSLNVDSLTFKEYSIGRHGGLGLFRC
jgi:hypothetical protein